MPILEVEVKEKTRVGKFGSSYIDLHDTVKTKRRIPFSTQQVDPFFSDDPLVCRPTLTKSINRPAFAIERGDIPQFNCEIPEALEKEIEFLSKGTRKESIMDPFLTESDGLFQDIRKSDNLGEVNEANDKIDQLVCVSGISFSLTEKIPGRDTEIRILNKPKIHWSFGLEGSYLNQYNCSDGKIFAPILLTDRRNQQGLNLARQDDLGQATRWSWFSFNNRMYLEIRHGLNTLKYTVAVDSNVPGGDFRWLRNPFKNTFVLAKHNLRSRQNQTWGNGWNRWQQFDPKQWIPRGVLTVRFYADPCDVIDSTATGYDGVQDPNSGDFTL